VHELQVCADKNQPWCRKGSFSSQAKKQGSTDKVEIMAIYVEEMYWYIKSYWNNAEVKLTGSTNSNYISGSFHQDSIVIVSSHTDYITKDG
jgi:hypothetical protein